MADRWCAAVQVRRVGARCFEAGDDHGEQHGAPDGHERGRHPGTEAAGGPQPLAARGARGPQDECAGGHDSGGGPVEDLMGDLQVLSGLRLSAGGSSGWEGTQQNTP